MRWKRIVNFIVTVVFSFFFFVIALLNFIGPIHPPITTIQGPRIHPLFSLAYLFIALIVSWSLYASTRRKPGRRSFFVLVVVNIGLIFAGLFLWSWAIRFEDTVISLLTTMQVA